MADLPIHWILARTHGHATEVEARVVQALDEACPGPAPERRRLEGPYGAPLIVLSRRLARKEAIAKAWGRWADAGIARALASTLDSRLDGDGVLHFRLDKQKAYQGILALADTADAVDVQVKLKAFPAKAEVIRKAARILTGAD